MDAHPARHPSPDDIPHDRLHPDIRAANPDAPNHRDRDLHALPTAPAATIPPDTRAGQPGGESGERAGATEAVEDD